MNNLFFYRPRKIPKRYADSTALAFTSAAIAGFCGA